MVRKAKPKNPVDRVLKLSSSGVPESEIIDSLRKDGFSPNEVDRILKEAVKKRVNKAIAHKVKKPPKAPKKRTVLSPPPRVMKRVKGLKIRKAPELKTESRDMKRLQREITLTQSEIGRFLHEIKRNREHIAELELLRSEVKELEKQLENSGLKDFQEEFHKQIEKIHNAIKESSGKTEEHIEKTEIEIKSLKKDLDAVKNLENVIENLDIKGIRTDLESLKSKAEWLESQLEKISSEPLYERIKELENRINLLKASSPVIIE